MKRVGAMVFATVLLGTSAARAAVSEVQATGFQLKDVVTIEAPPTRVYAALVKIGRWWNPEHSYSGVGSNLTLDPRAGGCFCEALPNGGGVHHMTVVMAMPGKLLRMSGALGPLQAEGLTGSMTWSLKPKDQATELALSYSVGGYSSRPFSEWAPDVDGVLSEQIGRLKKFVETGKP